MEPSHCGQIHTQPLQGIQFSVYLKHRITLIKKLLNSLIQHKSDNHGVTLRAEFLLLDFLANNGRNIGASDCTTLVNLGMMQPSRVM